MEIKRAMARMHKVKGSEEKPACRTAKAMIWIKHRRKESDNQSLTEFVFYVLGKLWLAMGELRNLQTIRPLFYVGEQVEIASTVLCNSVALVNLTRSKYKSRNISL